MREVDLLLGRFANAEIGNLSDDELDAYETLLEAIDRDIFAWLTGEEDPPSALRYAGLAKNPGFP